MLTGREREERDAADSPSMDAQALSSAIDSQNTYGQFSGLLTVSNSLVDRYIDYECLTGDTKIHTLKGPIPIRDLAAMTESDSAFRFHVFTWDHKDKKVTVGIGQDARRVKTDAIFKVTLDDGQEIRCTGNHRFMRRDGTYAVTTDLYPGDSLMPLYLHTDPYGRRVYKENEGYHLSALTRADGKRQRRVARMVYEWMTGSRITAGVRVKHVGDVTDDSPKNITTQIHSDSYVTYVPFIKAMKNAQSLIEEEDVLAFPPINHKVSKIEELGYDDDVYCLDVPGTHNYAVGDETGGVFTHNSMDEYPDIHTANDYFANDATQPDIDKNRVVWVESNDHALSGSANTLLRKKLRLDDEMYSIAYGLIKYGNDFEEVLVTENGVVGLNYLPPATVRRIDSPNGALLGFVQDMSGNFPTDTASIKKLLMSEKDDSQSKVALFEDWQVVQMRLRSTHRRSPYGYACADGARWIWKRLVMLEDATLIYKLTRAPSRFAFYIDVTDVPTNRVGEFLRKAKNDLKKRKLVDPNTGKLSMQYNPLASDEDFFLPVRDGRELARIDQLTGPEYQAMEPVEYFQRKLHSVLKVPKEYLGGEGSIPGRAILSNEDVRAARQTLNIQKELRSGVERIVRIDAAARGVADPSNLDFNVRMTMPSGIYALTAYEVKNSQADFASRVEPFVSKDWIRRNVFHFSDEEIKAIEAGAKNDQAGDGAYESSASDQMKLLDSVSEKQRGDTPVRSKMLKTIEDRMRQEDIRTRESDKKSDRILEKLDHLIHSDKAFAKRHNDRVSFAKSLKDGGFSRVNGSVSPVPTQKPSQ